MAAKDTTEELIFHSAPGGGGWLVDYVVSRRPTTRNTVVIKDQGTTACLPRLFLADLLGGWVK